MGAISRSSRAARRLLDLGAVVVSGASRLGLGGARWMLDRTAVLMVGLGLGAMIGVAFVGHGAASFAPAAGHFAPPAPGLAVIAPASPTPSALPPSAPMGAADCPAPFPPHLLDALAKGEPVTVGVFGDSFGDGVWAALYHLLAKDKSIRVIKFSREATGFTRYASLNLEDDVESKLAAQPVDIAVVDFGANDTQGLYDGHKAYPLLSNGWRSVYGQRVDRYVNLLRRRGAMVYWLGPPKMRKPDYDRQIADMSAFYSDRMASLGVPFIDTVPLSVDENGAFNDYLGEPGSTQRHLMRAGDGVHMTMAGYERIAAPLAQRIEAYVARARATVALDAMTAASTKPATVVPSAAPSRS
jgi:hypothetical protein